MLGKILEHKATLIIGIVACLVVAIFGGYYLLRPETRQFTTAVVSPRDISETITASGKVDSDSHVTLSFKQSGTVASVNVKVGDVVYKGQVLATLNAGSLEASLAEAKADVLSAEASLTSLQKGATPQTRAVYSQNIATAQSDLATANEDAYLKVHDAITNDIDTLFQNGASPNPQFIPPVESYTIGLALTAARIDIGSRLATWNSSLTQNALSSTSLADAVNTLAAVKSFMNQVSAETNRLTPSNSGLTTNQVGAYILSASAAASAVNAASSEFTSANQAYESSIDQADVIEASSTPEAITMAEAALAKAQANQASVQSQLQDTMLIAPFGGVIGSVNPKVGEVFNASDPAIDVLSQGNYKIDILIPENEIGAVTVGAPALVTFDAYGSNLEATATVASVDLSETMTNGVGAYKATVYLNSANPTIRTGMTGNVSIEGPTASGVLTIPTSAIINENDNSFVLFRNQSGSFVMRQITTGLVGEGGTEVTSGLNQGDVVAAFGNFNQ